MMAAASIYERYTIGWDVPELRAVSARGHAADRRADLPYLRPA